MRSRPHLKMTLRGWLPLLAFVAFVAVFTWLIYPWQKQAWLSQFLSVAPH
jgi:hypothetical protein